MGYIRISWQHGCVAAATLCLMGCAVGPDYHKPAVQIPESFKEGVDWQRTQANPQGSLSSTWWLDYHDEQLSKLIDASLPSESVHHRGGSRLPGGASDRLRERCSSLSHGECERVRHARRVRRRRSGGKQRFTGCVSLCHRQRCCELGARSMGQDPSPDRIEQGQRAGQRRPARGSALVDRSQCCQRLFCIAPG